MSRRCQARVGDAEAYQEHAGAEHARHNEAQRAAVVVRRNPAPAAGVSLALKRSILQGPAAFGGGNPGRRSLLAQLLLLGQRLVGDELPPLYRLAGNQASPLVGRGIATPERGRLRLPGQRPSGRGHSVAS